VTRPDLEKLLGGYAAGTLTAEERRALFDAALADQTLFDALADEEALREVLADPACRERVQSALVEPPRTIWLRRPAVWALAATVAAAVVLTVAVVRTRPARVMAPAPQRIAMAKKPELPDFVTSAPEQRAAHASRQQAVTEARPAPRGFTPPATVTAAQPAFAPPASVSANEPAPAAPVKELAAAPPARTGSLASRLQPSAPAAAGAAAPAPPPPPAASTQAVTVTSASEAISPADQTVVRLKRPASLPVTGRDAAKLIKVMPGAGLTRQAPEGKAGSGAGFGLRYTLIRNGAEVPPDTTFSPGEPARLRVEADEGGYLYVLAGKRALFAGSVPANRPVLIDTKERVLHLVLLPEPDSGPLSTLVSRTRQQFSGVNLRVQGQTEQRSGDQSVSVQNSSPPPQTGVLADVSINSR
jgi:hypothetical protein